MSTIQTLPRRARARILFACDVPASRDTGMGRHQWYLAKALSELDFSVEQIYAEDIPTRVPQPFRRFEFPVRLAVRVMRAARQGNGCQAVIIHEGSAAFVCVLRRMGLLAGTQCIVVSHNPEQKVWELNLALAEQGRHKISRRSRMLWPLTRLWQSNFALRAADVVLCLSEEDRAYINQRHRVLPQRIVLMHNGVDDSFFVENHAPASPRILFTGTWMPHKGTRELCIALTQALARNSEAQASLLGTSLGPAEILKEFPADVRSRIAVRQHIGPEELPAALAAHNIFVLPSWWEGMPLSLLEAMAAGLAVVVTDVGGMRDVVRDGIDGVRVAPHDSDALARAIQELCGDPGLRARLGGAARLRARAYSWQAAAKILAQAIPGAIPLEQCGEQTADSVSRAS